jgi:hypothetical protein
MAFPRVPTALIDPIQQLLKIPGTPIYPILEFLGIPTDRAPNGIPIDPFMEFLENSEGSNCTHDETPRDP